jgi:hypothetical protein
MFISLNLKPATGEDAAAALDAPRPELEAKGSPVKGFVGLPAPGGR